MVKRVHACSTTFVLEGSAGHLSTFFFGFLGRTVVRKVVSNLCLDKRDNFGKAVCGVFNLMLFISGVRWTSETNSFFGGRHATLPQRKVVLMYELKSYCTG